MIIHTEGQLLTLKTEDLDVDHLEIKGIINSEAKCESMLRSKILPDISLNTSLQVELHSNSSVLLKEVRLKKGEVIVIENQVLEGNCTETIVNARVLSYDGTPLLNTCTKGNVVCSYDWVYGRLSFAENCKELPETATIVLDIKTPSIDDLGDKKAWNRMLTASSLYLEFPGYGSFSAFAKPRYNCYCNEYAVDLTIITDKYIPQGRLMGIFPDLFDGYSFQFEPCEYTTSLFKSLLCKVNQSSLEILNTYQKDDYVILADIPIRFYNYRERNIYSYIYSFVDANTQEEITEITFAPTRTVSGTMTLIDDWVTVLEPTIFTATFIVPCTAGGKSLFVLTPFIGTRGICIEDTICGINEGNIELIFFNIEYGVMTFKFKSTVPTNYKNLNSPLTVRVGDDVTPETYILTLTFAKSLSLVASVFTYSSLNVHIAEAKIRSTYTFLVTLRYEAPEQCKLEVQFNPDMTFASDLTCDIDGQIKACTSLLNVLTISPMEAMDAGTSLTIVIDGVINPYHSGDYLSFFVKIRNKDDDLLAVSDSLSVNLDLKNTEATVISEVTHTTVHKELNLTFSFKPQELSEDYSSRAYIEIIVPSSGIECEPPYTVLDNLKKMEDFKFSASGPPTDPLIVTMFCKEPEIEDHEFTFILTDKGTSNRVTGKKKVTIKQGIVPLPTAFELICESSYPRTKTKCKLRFTRTTTDPIEVVMVNGKLISSSYGGRRLLSEGCTAGIEGLDSTCKLADGSLLITPVSAIYSPSFTVIDLDILNPDADEKDDMTISLRTFNSIYMTADSVVDNADSSVTSTVKCNYPCGDCTEVVTACLTCTSQGEDDYYLISDKNQCTLTCPTGTYPDATKVCEPCIDNCAICKDAVTCDSCMANFYKLDDSCITKCPNITAPVNGICRPCDGKCKTCINKVDYCTECNFDRYLYAGDCHDECQHGTGPYDSITFKQCVDCTAHCSKCIYGEGYLEPKICLKCYSHYVLANDTDLLPTLCVPEEEDDSASIPTYTIVTASVVAGVVIAGAVTGAVAGSSGTVAVVAGGAGTTGTTGVAATAGGTTGGATTGGGVIGGTTGGGTGGVAGGTAGGTGGAGGAGGTAGGTAGSGGGAGGSGTAGNADINIDSATNNSSNDSSYILVVNYLLLLCYATLLYRAIVKGNVLIIITLLLVMATQVILNIIFVFKVLGGVNDEVKSVIFSRDRRKIATGVMMFSVACTFQTTRLFFGSCCGLQLFSLSDENSIEIREPLNKYSIIQSVVVHLPVIGAAAIELVRLSWGTKLYLSVVDSSALSVLLLGMLIKESISDQIEVFKTKLKILDQVKEVVFGVKKKPKGGNKEKSEKVKQSSEKFKDTDTDIGSHKSLESEKAQSMPKAHKAKAIQGAKRSNKIPVASRDFLTEDPLTEENKEEDKNIVDINTLIKIDKASQKEVKSRGNGSSDEKELIVDLPDDHNAKKGPDKYTGVDMDSKPRKRKK